MPDEAVNNLYRHNIELKTENDTPLRGWFLENKSSDVFLIYFYGNGDSIYTSQYRMYQAAILFNVNVVCFDYRGYSYSGGSPSFQNILTDSLEIYDFVKVKYGAKMRKIFTYGQSLGTISALNIGVNRPVDGVILESTFAGADETVHEMGMSNIPFPLNLVVWLKPSEGLRSFKPQMPDLIRGLKSPLLAIHCETDRLFPIKIGKEMFEYAGPKEKYFTLVTNCSHQPQDISKGTVVNIAMDTFLQKYR
jgi:hypothetical protein